MPLVSGPTVTVGLRTPIATSSSRCVYAWPAPATSRLWGCGCTAAGPSPTATPTPVRRLPSSRDPVARSVRGDPPVGSNSTATVHAAAGDRRCGGRPGSGSRRSGTVRDVYLSVRQPETAGTFKLDRLPRRRSAVRTTRDPEAVFPPSAKRWPRSTRTHGWSTCGPWKSACRNRSLPALPRLTRQRRSPRWPHPRGDRHLWPVEATSLRAAS